MNNTNPKENYASLSPREDEIFARAIEIDSIADRNRYLDEACGDDGELRAQLDGLLCEYEQPDSFFVDPDRQSNDLQIEEDARPSKFGDFQIVREIGRGGMGIVYEARQESLNRNVALKVLSVGLGYSSKAVVRFRREAEAAARLHHSNIVPIHYTGIEGQLPYNVMELIDGPSLAQIIKTLRDQADTLASKAESAKGESPVTKLDSDDHSSEAEFYSTNSRRAAATVSDSSSFGTGTDYFDNVARVIGDVADALAHAHQKGVIHRDIKPSNLLLSPDGRLSITDFGLARLVEQPGVTMTGEFMGSPMYTSPEQVAHVGSVDHRTDIYSLGATLYELLTFRPPFKGSGREQILHQVVNNEPKAARRVSNTIPRDLETICRKAMEKRPEDRYQSADAMADDLRRFVSRHAISARRIGPVGHTIRWCRRNRTQAALIGLLIVMAAATTSLFVSNKVTQERRFSFAVEKINNELKEAPWKARVDWSEAVNEFPRRRKELQSMVSRMGPKIEIESDEPGAEVAVRPYNGDSADWLSIGVTPLETHLPHDRYLVRISKDDHEDLFTLRTTETRNADSRQRWRFLLPTTPGMVRIPKAWHQEDPSACRIPWLLSKKLPLIEAFEMDRTEVTNAEFYEFVHEAGGYSKREFWIDELGESWKEIVNDQFRDESGQFVGPKYWVNGEIPIGLDNHPVTGISWYEAMAYSKWANKQLPTLYHWMRGANFDGRYDGVNGWTRSNIGGKKGSLRSVNVASLSTSEYGTFDTLGNVREWCVNEDQDGKRYAMGGSYRDPSGRKFDSVSYSAYARLEDVGFRCARYKADVELAKAAPTFWRPIPTQPAALDSLRDLFLPYAKSDLDVRGPDTVLFDGVASQAYSIKAAYGEAERITCYLFLPDDRKFAKPFQLVFGSVVLEQARQGGPSMSNGSLKYYEAMRKRGRAIMVPTLYGASYDRVEDGFPTYYDRYPDDLAVAANRALHSAQDVTKVMDFVEEYGPRLGIDANRVAFCSCYGSCIYSPCWLVGDEITAGKRRFRAAIFPNGGLINCIQPPECDQLTYLPHFRIPSLLFTTAMKFDIPYDYSQKKFLELMPMPSVDTKHYHDNNHRGLSLEDFDRVVDEWLTAKMGRPKKVEDCVPMTHPSL